MKFIALIVMLGSLVYADSLYEQGQKAYKEKKYNEAVSLYYKACDAGEAKACGTIGYLLSVRENYEGARKFYDQACKLGNALSCTQLGRLHLLGQGGIEDDTKAFIFFNKACVKDDPSGCYYLGVLYYFGNGVNQDINRANGLFQKACDLDQEYCKEK